MREQTCIDLSAALVFIVGTTLLAPWAFARDYGPGRLGARFNSPDGNYVATAAPVGTRKNMHYQVCKRGSSSSCFETHAQYETHNDVKAGLFSPDSRQFAAAYHYGHQGEYTWIGIWSLPDGNLVNTIKRPGFVRDLTGVFNSSEFTSSSTTSGRRDARKTNEISSTGNTSRGGDAREYSQAREYIRITRSRSRPDCDRAAGSTMYTYVFAENKSSRPIEVKLTWSSRGTNRNPGTTFSKFVDLQPNSCRQIGPEKDFPLGIKIEDAWYTGSRY